MNILLLVSPISIYHIPFCLAYDTVSSVWLFHPSIWKLSIIPQWYNPWFYPNKNRQTLNFSLTYYKDTYYLEWDDLVSLFLMMSFSLHESIVISKPFFSQSDFHFKWDHSH